MRGKRTKVTVLYGSADSEPFTREGNMEWVRDYVARVLLEDPAARIVINPTLAIQGELHKIVKRRQRQ